MATYTEMNGTEWKICAIRSAESLVGNLGKLRYFIVLIICFCAVISIVVIILFARNITMPLEQLSVLMDKVTQDECFQGQFQYPYKDEVGKLAKSFNFMIIKINH